MRAWYDAAVDYDKNAWRGWYSVLLRILGIITFIVGLHYTPKPWGFFGMLIGIYVFMVGMLNKKKYERSRRGRS